MTAKQLLFRISLVVVGFIGLLAIIGSLLPRHFDVSTSVVIDAPAETVFGQVNELRNWAAWSSWSPNSTPNLTIEYGQNTVGKGGSQKWTDLRGEGKIWITESTPFTSLDYELEFRTFSKMLSRFEFVESDDHQTTVTWTSKGELPSGPFYGWFAFLFESGMQYEYEKNLDKLKKVSEAAKALE